MTNKEYKKAREEQTYYNGFDYLYPEEVKAVRMEIRHDRKNGGFTVEGLTDRAVIIPQNNGGYLLKSYYTIVAAIVNGKFYRIWNGYSATTMKHINSFREHFGLEKMNKREWIEENASREVIDTETGEILFSI